MGALFVPVWLQFRATKGASKKKIAFFSRRELKEARLKFVTYKAGMCPQVCDTRATCRS